MHNFLLEDIRIMSKAKDITEIPKSFSIYALEDENFENFYVDVNSARGKDVVKRIITRFLYNDESTLKLLFLGHYGCGKTTELYRAEKELSKNYLVIRFSIANETDIVNLSYIDFIFAILNNLVKVARDNNVKLPKNVVDNLYDYWNDERITEICDCEKLKAEASVEAKLKWFNILTAKIKGIMQTGLETKTTIRKKVEPSLKILLKNINELIDTINEQISPKKLLLIVEDLDKLEIEQSENLFVSHRQTITSLNLNLIYTFPIFLYYSYYYNEIINDFDSEELLSIIKVHNRDGSDFPDGINMLKRIVWKRCEKELIDEDALEFLIKKSGGAFRDLFIMISNAAICALTDDDTPAKCININYAKSSYRAFRSRKERAIKKSHINILKEIYNDKSKKPIGDDDNILMELLQSMSVIEYNGERWCDLHPAIKDYLLEKKEIEIDT